MRVKLVLGFLFVFLVFSACDSNRVYDEYKTLPNQWNKDSIITFNVNPPDSTYAYNVFVNLRNTNEYKYSNLFLIVSTKFPNGKVITDTLEYRMTNPNGEFLGTGFSDIKENKLWYKEDIVFREFGEYKFVPFRFLRVKIEGLYLNSIPELSKFGNFKVEASFGHIRALDKKNGINMDTFEANYIIDPDKNKIVNNLKKLVLDTRGKRTYKQLVQIVEAKNSNDEIDDTLEDLDGGKLRDQVRARARKAALASRTRASAEAHAPPTNRIADRPGTLRSPRSGRQRGGRVG